MAYQIAAIAVTLNDLEGLSQVAGLFKCNTAMCVDDVEGQINDIETCVCCSSMTSRRHGYMKLC